AERYIGRATGTTLPVPPHDVPRTQTLKGPDDIWRFYGNAVVERGPWLLSVGIPTSIGVQRAAPLFRRDAVIAVSAVVTVLLLALGGSTLMAGGIDRIHAAVRRIAHGDLSPPERSPVP